MAQWSQKDIAKHMRVISTDQHEVGHVAEVYEDSFLIHKGYFLPKDRYIPYSAIAQVDGDGIHLTMSADEIKDKEWSVRPDYEDHPGDPLQHFYDKGHGLPDSFDETNPDKA